VPLLRACQAHTLQLRVNTHTEANNEIRQKRKITSTHDTVNDAKKQMSINGISLGSGIGSRIGLSSFFAFN